MKRGGKSDIELSQCATLAFHTNAVYCSKCSTLGLKLQCLWELKEMDNIIKTYLLWGLGMEFIGGLHGHQAWCPTQQIIATSDSINNKYKFCLVSSLASRGCRARVCLKTKASMRDLTDLRSQHRGVWRSTVAWATQWNPVFKTQINKWNVYR